MQMRTDTAHPHGWSDPYPTVATVIVLTLLVLLVGGSCDDSASLPMGYVEGVEPLWSDTLPHIQL